MLEESKIVSAQLSINAYKKASTRVCKPELILSSTICSIDKMKPESAQSSARKAREIKSSVLISLQEKSNSGMVNMREVAVALDHILKRS